MSVETSKLKRKKLKDGKISKNCSTITKVIIYTNRNFRRKKEKGIIKVIMAKNFLKLMTGTKPQNQLKEHQIG